jgi:hypothetical protein
MNEKPGKALFRELYEIFSSPLSGLDCGQKCGPYNDYGVPVCCDINLVIPAAYEEEWVYLEAATDLWQLWKGSSREELNDMTESLQAGQTLIQCLGYKDCQRQFRSITCRAFPFYPYLDSSGYFMGLAYYDDFKEDCWIISNLEVISLQYILEFQTTYQRIFEIYPETRSGFHDYSGYIRDVSAGKSMDLVVLGFSGELLMIDPVTEKVSEGNFPDLAKFGPFLAARDLKFPDEIDLPTTGQQRE